MKIKSRITITLPGADRETNLEAVESHLIEAGWLPAHRRNIDNGSQLDRDIRLETNKLNSKASQLLLESFEPNKIELKINRIDFISIIREGLQLNAARISAMNTLYETALFGPEPEQEVSA